MERNNSYTAIILCGGDINHSHLPIGTNRSNAMIPVNGKPVIGWILDDLERKGLSSIVVVLQFENERLYNYLRWTYSHRLDLHFAFVPPNGNILNSLLTGLSWVPPDNKVYMLLGDTLIEDRLPLIDDFLFVGPYEESENWCIATENENGYLVKLFDKERINLSDSYALAGGYSFSRTELLRNIVVRAIQRKEKELSAAIVAYNLEVPLKLIPANKWFDFGHIEGFNKAKKNLLQCRFFNSLSIDPIRGLITKQSENKEKLLDELNWYEQLPKSLRVFRPRVIEINKVNAKYTMELYGYPNLAELFLFSDINLSIWKNIVEHLLAIHDEFRTYSRNLSSEILLMVYRDKTADRLNSLRENVYWDKLLSTNKININGSTYINLPELQGELNQAIELLAKPHSGCIIHGDFCFSNILYDVNNHIAKLIDPRGSFGERGLYGDPRYDIAKLRHSINGLYDVIVSDLFTLRKGDNFSFEFKLFRPEGQSELSKLFDRNIESRGYDLKEITLIEALLFISMIPYHSDYENRQIAMFLTGIQKLNQIILNENCN